MIDGGDGVRQPFYDLEGNVWEWTKDLSRLADQARTKRGGSYYEGTFILGITDRNSSYPQWGYGNLGFRLVRTNR